MASEINGFDKHRQPNGEITFFNADGSETKFYTAQCVHCGLMWTVLPGSGRLRGYCTKCPGTLCGDYSCMTKCVYMEKWLETIEGKASKAQHDENQKIADEIQRKNPNIPLL